MSEVVSRRFVTSDFVRDRVRLLADARAVDSDLWHQRAAAPGPASEWREDDGRDSDRPQARHAAD